MLVFLTSGQQMHLVIRRSKRGNRHEITFLCCFLQIFCSSGASLQKSFDNKLRIERKILIKSTFLVQPPFRAAFSYMTEVSGIYCVEVRGTPQLHLWPFTLVPSRNRPPHLSDQRLIKQTARASMPSPRPTNPSPSVVVALMLTASFSTWRSGESVSRIASM